MLTARETHILLREQILEIQMRYIFSAIVLLLSMGAQLNAAEIGALEDAAVTDEFNPQAVCEQLASDFGGRFYLESTPETGKFKIRSESGDRIVWVLHPPRSVYQAEGVEITQSRFDNLGQKNSIFYLHIENKSYKLHLSESAASLIARKDIPASHIALIKAWIATFKGQPISTSMVIRTE